MTTLKPQLPKAAIRAFDDLNERFLRADHFTADQMFSFSDAAIKLNIAQPEQPATVQGEPVYQILQGYPSDPVGTWRDASKTSYDKAPPDRKRTLYTTPQPAEGDAKDAERYRLIRSEISIEEGMASTKTGIQSALMAWWPGVGPIDSDADDAIDKAIDAAIASQKAKP